MIKTKHLFDYIFLILTSLLFLVGLYLMQGQRLASFIVVLIFAGIYILWGIYHHGSKHILSLRVVIEYILIAFSVLFLLQLFIL